VAFSFLTHSFVVVSQYWNLKQLYINQAGSFVLIDILHAWNLLQFPLKPCCSPSMHSIQFDYSQLTTFHYFSENVNYLVVYLFEFHLLPLSWTLLLRLLRLNNCIIHYFFYKVFYWLGFLPSKQIALSFSIHFIAILSQFCNLEHLYLYVNQVGALVTILIRHTLYKLQFSAIPCRSSSLHAFKI